MKTIRELAQEALDVQDACNLSGVAQYFSFAILDLRVALQGSGAGTSEINHHPIVTVWLSKMLDLNGDLPSNNDRMLDAFERVKELARREGEPT